MARIKELSYDQCKWICDPSQFLFKSTAELDDIEGLIGQERAVKSMEFGLQVKIRGYNIYMAGPNGTGKTSYAKNYIKKIAEQEVVPDDWCYVFNFREPTKPKALRFSPGKGREFKEDVEQLVETLKEKLMNIFKAEDYEKEKEELVKGYKEKRDQLIQQLYRLAKQKDFEIKNTSTGIYFMPIVNGRAISQEEYDGLEITEKKEIDKRSDIVEEEAIDIIKKVRQIEEEAKKTLLTLEDQTALMAVELYFNSIQEKYKEHKKASSFLEEMKQEVLHHLDDFVEEEEEEPIVSVIPLISKQSAEDPLLKYKVNLFIDHSEDQGAPMVLDFHPTYYNLIGCLEYDSEYGKMVTDFTKIKPGLLHKANEGYLILRIQDVLSNIQSWETLKRVLKTGEIVIENIREQLGLVEMASLKPEPIPFQAKIILLGSEYLYHLLYQYDEDFKKLFKIKCDFDIDMIRDQENVENIARFIKKFCEEENQLHFTKEAVAKIIEYSSRLANNQERLSARFHNLIEVLAEACTWAKIEKRQLVEPQDVRKAIEEREYRASSYEEKLQDMLQKNILLVETEQKVVGQVNGLAVLDIGDYSFGKPSKITATVCMGRSGIINIEKESSLSGKIHDKGVLVLAGYIGETYGQNIPFAINARICFEQLYSGVDGDSASSAELYAILSNLADVPIKQSIAVTGSLNQKGEIQPVGGVNEKIEGFFKLCKVRGLTGEHGVILPIQNVKDLVLKDEVVEAVKDEKFHIYPVSSIEEGIEILTGVPAGVKDEEGNYPKGSIHDRVMRKILQYAKDTISFGKSKENNAKKRNK